MSFAFDWWIRNGDRTLSERGGNPNLFWNVLTGTLVVLDHNQAFDPAFSALDFSLLHCFKHVCPDIARDWVIQAQLESRFQALMADFSSICDTVPHAWWFVDDEQTLRVDFDKERVRHQLTNFAGPAYWNFP